MSPCSLALVIIIVSKGSLIVCVFSVADLSQNGCEGRYASIQLFQEKADDAGIVIVVISKAFSMSKTCQQQVCISGFL